MVQQSHSQLLKRVADGDARAFDLIYEELRPPLYSFLVRLSGRVDLAEDLLQETWLRLARHAPRIAPDTELRPWLFTVARNLFRTNRRRALLNTVRLQELLFTPTEPSVSPFEQLSANRTEGNLERAVSQLPTKYREIILLCGHSGLSPSEVASIVNISPEAARQRLARGRARLRILLDKAGKNTA